MLSPPPSRIPDTAEGAYVVLPCHQKRPGDQDYADIDIFLSQPETHALRKNQSWGDSSLDEFPNAPFHPSSYHLWRHASQR